MFERFGWLGQAGDVGEVGAAGVDPGDAGDEVGVFGVAAEGRQQHWRSRPRLGGGLLPDALARQRGVDQRRHVRRSIGAGRRVFRLRAHPDLGKRLQRRPTLFRCFEAVVPVLDFRDDGVAAVLAQPLDAGNAEADVVLFAHRGQVGGRRRDETGDRGEQKDPSCSLPEGDCWIATPFSSGAHSGSVAPTDEPNVRAVRSGGDHSRCLPKDRSLTSGPSPRRAARSSRPRRTASRP